VHQHFLVRRVGQRHTHLNTQDTHSTGQRESRASDRQSPHITHTQSTGQREREHREREQNIRHHTPQAPAPLHTLIHVPLVLVPYAVVAGLDCAWSCMIVCLLSESIVHQSFCVRGVERGDA
jgi:hypothetical protein